MSQEVPLQPSPASGPAHAAERWSREAVAAVFELPFNDLLFRAQSVHREHFDPNRIQVSQLLSIKTGGCPEDCKYCPQSAHHSTDVDREHLLTVRDVVAAARQAQAQGATRYCMGAAWRSPSDRDLPRVLEMVGAVKALGLETCATLGMLTAGQARALRDAGLDYYNHNIDTSEAFYGEIVTTRTFDDRLETLAHVRQSGIKVCCGGIVGMGERRSDRVDMLHTLANLSEPPESVPVNLLVKVDGTPLAEADELDPIEFVRTIAVARVLMPTSHVRLSAGRRAMSDELQALCFFAGANSVFGGPKLLTTGNPGNDADAALFDRLGLRPEPPAHDDA